MADLQRKGQVDGPSVVELLRINCDLFHASNAIALVHLRAGGEPDLALPCLIDSRGLFWIWFT